MSYRIILNLTGTASKKVDKLANDLVRADVAAASLARNLGKVAIASRGVKTIRSSGYVGGSRGTRGGTASDPRYTRHRSTRILSFGSGWNIGGFSGRFSSIFQPDTQGKLMGMNAARLMKGANIASLAASILKTVGKVLIKTVGAATLAPMAIGGGVMVGALRALQSESFAGGVRLIARRHQARLGLGAEYERGQRSADFISQAYGFDRSTTLSSINVLSGMGVGGTDRVLSTGEAAGLTKVGGLIAQQSGTSFERVMTNIQQLLVQTTPHIRDIREMLNQAPILGKYAMKDMTEQGIKGVDVRTWFKNSANIMSALKRYELDLASNAGMRARGQISLAQQDAWASIAGNDQAWTYFGFQGAKIINSLAEAINNLLTTITSNDAFLVMFERLNLAIEMAGTDGVNFIDKFSKKIERFSEKYGLPLGDPSLAKESVYKQKAIKEVIGQADVRSSILAYASGAGYFAEVPATVRGQSENMLMLEILSSVRKDSSQLSAVRGMVEYEQAGVFTDKRWSALGNKARRAKALGLQQYMTDSTSLFIPELDLAGGNAAVSNPMTRWAAYATNKNNIIRAAQKYIDDYLSTGAGIPTGIKGAGAAGSDLTGFNRDRRALEIHFNAPIVEWTNTMETATPQETVDAVAENIEQIAAAAIQKALLGASNKMSSRWY